MSILARARRTRPCPYVLIHAAIPSIGRSLVRIRDIYGDTLLRGERSSSEDLEKRTLLPMSVRGFIATEMLPAMRRSLDVRLPMLSAAMFRHLSGVKFGAVNADWNVVEPSCRLNPPDRAFHWRTKIRRYL